MSLANSIRVSVIFFFTSFHLVLTNYTLLFLIFFFRNYYSPGSATLYFDRHSLGMNPMDVVFDSGSTYTYFTAQPYQATVYAVN